MPVPHHDPSARRRRSAGRGFALILTLLLVTMLSILVVELSFVTKAEVRIAQNYSHDLQNYYALDAGLQFAKLFLKEDFERNAGDVADHLHEVWSSSAIVRQVGAASVTVRIVDEDRKFNVNALVASDGKQDPYAVRRFERMIDNLGFEGVDLTGRIIDYIDPDESDADVPEAKNAPLIVADELRLVKGLPKELLDGHWENDTWFPALLDYVSVWSPPAQINVNTADRWALQALSDRMSKESAEAVIAYRDTPDQAKEGEYQVFRQGSLAAQLADAFTNYGARMGADEATTLANELLPQLTTQSLIFSVHLLATHGSESQRARAVLYRNGSSGFQLLYWKIEGDAYAPADLGEPNSASSGK